ncbi:hypothetical protein KLEP7_gp148 [Pseudaeromonas phage vB_PpeM_ KLEP7]|nr:hypothetical protein KLEP7_gp148 [Pseudaeromonas phage vB_PpeM_ KLEP7]
MKVIIDNVVYVPRCDIDEVGYENLNKALKELVSLFYFGDWHKAQPRIWEALNYIDPNLAELVYDDPEAAYSLLSGEDKC